MHKNFHRRFILTGLCLFMLGYTLQAQEKPRIGLTLSGGGARGFAHIGVLHIIDSLGLEIDYISGTSMGSIVGGLYAAGYSAGEIENIALSVDWTQVFNARPALHDVHIRERRNSGKTMIELPLEELKIKIGTGAIEGQQLWSLLEKYFFHKRENHDFLTFTIPFACVATNVENGEPHVMKGGDIVSALRASMAIPAVFSSVQRDGMKLIDGGVVNNFPVDVVRDMGAEYVIGVFVSQGLKPADELKTPVDIIYQMGFFKDAFMYQLNLSQTDLYIQPGLSGYTAGSFTDVQAIIEEGKQAARMVISEIKALLHDEAQSARANAVSHERTRHILVEKISHHGLNNIRSSYLNNMISLQTGDSVNAAELERIVNRLYASGYFERVLCHFEPIAGQPKHKHLIFTYTEKPLASLQLGVHYNSFSGMGLLAGVSTNRFLIYNLKGSLLMRLGEHAALSSGLSFFLTEKQQNWIDLKLQADVFEFPLYDRFSSIAVYEQSFVSLMLDFNHRLGQNASLVGGMSVYGQRLKPRIFETAALSGQNRGSRLRAGIMVYSLDQHHFARSGHDLQFNLSYFFGQSPSFQTMPEEANISPEELGIRVREFTQLTFNWSKYHPVKERSSFFTRVQAAYNFNYTQGFLNVFNIGGIYPSLRDQVRFSGLNEYEITTPSVMALALGWNYNFWSQFYVAPLLNVALYDFSLEKLTDVSKRNLVMGAGMHLGFLSPAGPLKAGFGYSPQSGSFVGTINLGWAL